MLTNFMQNNNLKLSSSDFAYIRYAIKFDNNILRVDSITQATITRLVNLNVIYFDHKYTMEERLEFQMEIMGLVRSIETNKLERDIVLIGTPLCNLGNTIHNLQVLYKKLVEKVYKINNEIVKQFI